MLNKFFAILDALDAEEGHAEHHCRDEADDQERAAGGLRGPDRENYGQTAADENGGIGRAEGHADGRTGGGEVGEIPTAIDQVSAEESAEEHEFGCQENPHAEAGGIALLLR